MSSLRLAFELLCACDVLWLTTVSRRAFVEWDDARVQQNLAALCARLDATLLKKADMLEELSVPPPLSVVVQAAIDCLLGDLTGDERAARATALLIGVHDHIEKTCGAPCDDCRSGPHGAKLFRDWAWSALDESSRNEAMRKLSELDREP
jgi:hypothetical protein